MRDELLDELPPGHPTLDGLNAALWAWLSVEYHARTHSTTGRVPGLHFEAELAHLRPVPEDIALRDVFLHREIHAGVYRDVAVPLDRLANASGQRRALPDEEPVLDDLDMNIDALGLIQDEF